MRVNIYYTSRGCVCEECRCTNEWGPGHGRTGPGHGRTGPGHLGRDPDTLDANRTLWTRPGHPGRGPDTLDRTRTREHAELMSCGFKRVNAGRDADTRARGTDVMWFQADGSVHTDNVMRFQAGKSVGLLARSVSPSGPVCTRCALSDSPPSLQRRELRRKTMRELEHAISQARS